MVVEVLSVGDNNLRRHVITLIDMHMKLSEVDEALSKIGCQCRLLVGNCELLHMAFELVGKDFENDPGYYYISNYDHLPYNKANAEDFADWLFSLP